MNKLDKIQNDLMEVIKSNDFPKIYEYVLGIRRQGYEEGAQYVISLMQMNSNMKKQHVADLEQELNFINSLPNFE